MLIANCPTRQLIYLTLTIVFVQGMYAGVITLDGITPLHEACLGGHFACAKVLLEHGADVCLILYFLVINTNICM